MTSTPTQESRVSALSNLTRSARWLFTDCSARGRSSSVLLIVLSCLRSPAASRLVFSIAATTAALFWSSWPMNVRIWVSTDRTSSSRPDIALLSSETIVLSWHATAVEQQGERAEHLLDLRVAPGAVEADDGVV